MFLYSSSPLRIGDMLQDPQHMPETAGSTDPYVQVVAKLGL